MSARVSCSTCLGCLVTMVSPRVPSLHPPGEATQTLPPSSVDPPVTCRQAHMSPAPLLSRLEVASATTMSPSPSPPHLSQNMQLHDVTCKAAVRITRYGWVLGKLQYI